MDKGVDLSPHPGDGRHCITIAYLLERREERVFFGSLDTGLLYSFTLGCCLCGSGKMFGGVT